VLLRFDVGEGRLEEIRVDTFVDNEREKLRASCLKQFPETAMYLKKFY